MQARNREVKVTTFEMRLLQWYNFTVKAKILVVCRQISIFHANYGQLASDQSNNAYTTFIMHIQPLGDQFQLATAGNLK